MADGSSASSSASSPPSRSHRHAHTTVHYHPRLCRAPLSIPRPPSAYVRLVSTCVRSLRLRPYVDLDHEFGPRRARLTFPDSSDSNSSAHCPSYDGDHLGETPTTSPGSSDASFLSSLPSRSSAPLSNDAQYIPRPPNCFILFRTAFYKDHALEKHESGKHLSVKASAVWNQMPAEEHCFWERLADEKKREHRARYPSYQFSPTSKGTRTAAVKKASKKANATAKARAPRRPRRPNASPTSSTSNTPKSPKVEQKAPRMELEALSLALRQLPGINAVSHVVSDARPSGFFPEPTFSYNDQLITSSSPDADFAFVDDDYVTSYTSLTPTDMIFDYSLRGIADLDRSLTLAEHSTLTCDDAVRRALPLVIDLYSFFKQVSLNLDSVFGEVGDVRLGTSLAHLDYSWTTPIVREVPSYDRYLSVSRPVYLDPQTGDGVPVDPLMGGVIFTCNDKDVSPSYCCNAYHVDS
jgi:hypothetical protein